MWPDFRLKTRYSRVFLRFRFFVMVLISFQPDDFIALFLTSQHLARMLHMSS